MREHSISSLMLDRLNKRRRAIRDAFDVEIARLIGMRHALAMVETEVLLASLDCFDSPRNAALWLTSPETALCGRTPLNVAESAAGREEVMNLLWQFCTGLKQSRPLVATDDSHAPSRSPAVAAGALDSAHA